MPPSHSKYLKFAAVMMGTIPLIFGLLFMRNPRGAPAFFKFPPIPTVSAVDRTVDGLALLYAVRDVYWAASIYATALFGSRKALGWILIAGSGVAVVDGFVARDYAGQGEWNHWGYAPSLVVVGGMLAGALD